MSEAPARKYDPIAVSAESTVVAEYVPDSVSQAAYQSESALEQELVRLLGSQAYEYLPFTSEAQLVANLRTQLEALNGITFTDVEWERFFTTCIAGRNDGIVEKTVRIQEDHVQVLRRDDGSSKNITLLDKQNIHNNRLQVINQYEVDRADPGGERSGGTFANRYDVTVLVNGLPMVHIELKRRGVDLREAFNQINRYQRDSFWAGSGLFEYVQLFVISNGTLTKYYSNTTRSSHLKEAQRVDLVNDQTPQARKLSEAQESDVATFLAQLQIVLPVLGVNAIRESPTSHVAAPVVQDESPVFTLVLKKANVDARAQVFGNEFTVLKGSAVVAEWTATGNADGTRRAYDSYRARHEKLLADGSIEVADGVAILTRDVVFTSPSTAGAVILGRSCNGRVAWKWADTDYGTWEERGLS